MLDTWYKMVYINHKHETCSRKEVIKLNNAAIAKRLIELRNGRSREAVAKACGISVSALAMYEMGERIPRDDIKVRLANYYNRSVSFIFFAHEKHETCSSEKEVV